MNSGRNWRIIAGFALLAAMTWTAASEASVKRASAKKRSARTPEIYSAIETDEAAAQQPVSSPSYDVVPSELAGPLARRLQLVEILISKYHRAYDYRTHTVRELEAVLAQLDASKPSPAIAEPPTPVATPASAPEQPARVADGAEPQA